jgi:hypothetical protein
MARQEPPKTTRAPLTLPSTPVPPSPGGTQPITTRVHTLPSIPVPPSPGGTQPITTRVHTPPPQAVAEEMARFSQPEPRPQTGREFRLERIVPGAGGTGPVVADGILRPDGTITIHWHDSHHPRTENFQIVWSDRAAQKPGMSI